MKLGLRISDLKGMKVKEKIDLAKECHLDAIELSAAELIDHEETKQWKKIAYENNLNITTAGVGINLTDYNKRDEVREKFKKIIEGAHIIGDIPLFSRTMVAPENIPESETWKYTAEFTREITEICSEENILFAIEIDHAPCFVHTLERFEKLYNLVDHTNLKLNFDPTNLHVNGSDPFDSINKWGHLFIGGHIKDGIFRTEARKEVPLGEGEIDYPSILSRLQERGIDLTFHFEHLTTAEQVKDAVERMNHILQK